jgi:hypothetical protein
MWDKKITMSRTGRDARHLFVQHVFVHEEPRMKILRTPSNAPPTEDRTQRNPFRDRAGECWAKESLVRPIPLPTIPLPAAGNILDVTAGMPRHRTPLPIDAERPR